ncbi:hypothetical protein ACOMHN_035641 [Nucella lapillus]
MYHNVSVRCTVIRAEWRLCVSDSGYVCGPRAKSTVIRAEWQLCVSDSGYVCGPRGKSTVIRAEWRLCVSNSGYVCGPRGKSTVIRAEWRLCVSNSGYVCGPRGKSTVIRAEWRLCVSNSGYVCVPRGKSTVGSLARTRHVPRPRGTAAGTGAEAQKGEKEALMAEERARLKQSVLSQKMKDMAKLQNTLSDQKQELLRLERVYTQLYRQYNDTPTLPVTTTMLNNRR